MNTRPKLAICSSASFYPAVIELSYELEQLGFDVVLTKTAQKMKETPGKNTEAITDWASSTIGYHGKSLLIREHFEEIAQCDAVLVANYEKHGKQHYIGPNVLMEMGVGFYLHKPIYVLYGQPEDSPLIDEILGLEPVFLHGDLRSLKKHIAIE